MQHVHQRWATFLQVNRKAAPVIHQSRADNCGPNQKSGRSSNFSIGTGAKRPMWWAASHSVRQKQVFMALSGVPLQF